MSELAKSIGCLVILAAVVWLCGVALYAGLYTAASFHDWWKEKGKKWWWDS